MNDRVRELRKSLGLTLEKFGEYLGVTKVAISNIEKGNRNLTEQMFKAICNVNWNGKFVDEEWLRNGVGDMFIALPPEDEVGAIVSELIEDKKNPFYNMILETMRTYMQLTPENKIVFTNFCQDLLANLQKRRNEA